MIFHLHRSEREVTNRDECIFPQRGAMYYACLLGLKLRSETHTYFPSLKMLYKWSIQYGSIKCPLLSSTFKIARRERKLCTTSRYGQRLSSLYFQVSILSKIITNYTSLILTDETSQYSRYSVAVSVGNVQINYIP